MLSNLNVTWQKRRGAFNHDWLKNTYIQSLSSWLNLLNDKIEDPHLEQSFVNLKLPEWEARLAEARSLSHDFISEMSPKIFFNVEPLANCSAETKSWLPDLIHQLWMARCSVESLVAEAEQAVETAQNAYEVLCAKLKSIPCVTSIKFLLKLKPEFQAFYEACVALGKAMEKFPGTVKVT